MLLFIKALGAQFQQYKKRGIKVLKINGLL